jgi:hypothetical protein
MAFFCYIPSLRAQEAGRECAAIGEAIDFTTSVDNNYRFAEWTFQNPPKNFEPAAFLHPELIQRFKAKFPKLKLEIKVFDRTIEAYGQKIKSLSVKAYAGEHAFISFDIARAPWKDSGMIIDYFFAADITNESEAVHDAQVYKGLPMTELKYLAIGIKNFIKASGATTAYTSGSSDYLTFKLYEKMFRFKPFGTVPTQTYAMLDELYKLARRKFTQKDRILSVGEFSKKLGRVWLRQGELFAPEVYDSVTQDVFEDFKDGIYPRAAKTYRLESTKKLAAISFQPDEGGRSLMFIDHSDAVPELLDWQNLYADNRLQLFAELD